MLFDRWIISKKLKLKYSSILTYLTLTTLSHRADYLEVSSNKTYRHEKAMYRYRVLVWEICSILSMTLTYGNLIGSNFWT